MHQHALRYSADPAVTLGQLKSNSYIFSGEVGDVSDWLDSHKVFAMVAGQPDYFFGFSLINNPPYIVYAQGDISLLHRAKLALVGPRAMTTYGKQVVEYVFDSLHCYDVVTISGGADGVDMLCHQLSFQYGIPTIVVLGGGLRWYWRSNRHSFLQKVIDNGGLILSEFKLDMQPNHYTFPQRNRIVAGLSDVLCVPEAREGSGSLITLDFALCMRKPVYGAPASMFATASHGLMPYLVDGRVKVLFNVDHMLSKYFIPKDSPSPVLSTLSLDPLQEKIVALCVQGEVSLDLLLEHCGCDAGQALYALTFLEMHGLIVQSGPNIYRYAQKIAKAS